MQQGPRVDLAGPDTCLLGGEEDAPRVLPTLRVACTSLCLPGPCAGSLLLVPGTAVPGAAGGAAGPRNREGCRSSPALWLSITSAFPSLSRQWRDCSQPLSASSLPTATLLSQWVTSTRYLPRGNYWEKLLL